ncbi:AMP-binding protein [Ruegeria sp. SCP11]|uniref:AMP-binding protein n=1 Tax=Ruegeria sp. SCP11 TaxID=3141378 RepID=UPI00333D2C73
MNALQKIVAAIGEGLACQAESSPRHPNSKTARPKFDFQVRRNQICAIGWLLYLFGTLSNKDIGRVILDTLPLSELGRIRRRAWWRVADSALIRRQKLSQAIDNAVGTMKETSAFEINEAMTGVPDSEDLIAQRIRRLIGLHAEDKARELFELHKAKLGDHFENLHERLNTLENGILASVSGYGLVKRQVGSSDGKNVVEQFSETELRTAEQQILGFVLEDTDAGNEGSLDALLSEVSSDPSRARSLLRSLNNNLDSSYRDQLIKLTLTLAPMARFEVFSDWPWVDGELMANALEEAIAAGDTYKVEKSLMRAMFGRLSLPPKDSSERHLFEKLLLLATGKAEFGLTSLADYAEALGLRLVEPRSSTAAVFLADQEYINSPQGPVGGVEAALTNRAKEWLEDEAKKSRGLIVLSPHTQQFRYAEGRLQVALAGMGKPVQTTVLNAPETGDPLLHSDFLEAARNDGYDVTMSGRHSSNRNLFSSQYLNFVRSGGVLHIYIDSLLAPGKRVFAPWYLRPVKLPGFPAQLAISSGANVCFSATWINEDGAQVIDLIPLELPPQEGSAKVRAIWFMQQLARTCRDFAFAHRMPIPQRLFTGYGGLLPKRELVPIDSWLQSDAVRESKLCWLADYERDRIAIRMASECMTYESLAGLTLRMSQMLLHFQDTAPYHTRPDRKFGDQHRVLGLLPASPAAVVTQLASTAAGSLLCLGLPEDSDSQLAARLKAFDPDLVIVTVSLWSRLIASNPELNSRNALIIGDDCSEPALESLLQSFTEVPALPPLDLSRPAYVVYTSGSSGEPKGVVLAAGMASRMLVFNYDTPQTLLTVARWDTATALESLPAFVEKHSIILPPINGFSDLKQLCDLMIATSATALSAPCSILHGMLQNPEFSPEFLPRLNIFFPWGEPSRERLILDLVDRFPQAELNASYGATEFIDVSYGKLSAEELSRYQGSPGGRLLPGTRAVNVEGDCLKPGEIGRVEAIGYDRTLGNFEDLLSGERMLDPLKDPILLDDWVTVLPDGSLDILGRVDDVINIRGRRLSLNDVAEAAEKIAGVTRVFVSTILVRDINAVAIVVETKRIDVNALESELRRVITQKFFAAATPLRCLFLEGLPRLPSGKLDRSKLQTILESRNTGTSGVPNRPFSKSIASDTRLTPMLEVMQDFANQEGLAPCSRFNPDDAHPFLDSILSLILMLNIEERFGKLPAATVFDYQDSSTWRELAKELSDAL